MSALLNFANGSGKLYLVDNDGTSVISTLDNTTNNARKLLADASTSGALPPATGIYSATYGHRYFINADSGAVQGDLTGATEISRNVILRGLESSLPVNSYTIATGVLTPLRDSSIMVVNVETEGGAGTDDLDTITTTDYNTGDIIIFRGLNSAHVVTFKNLTGNITLSNSLNFATGTKIYSIALQYISGSGWFEISRSPNPIISVANLRSVAIAEPIQGVNTTALTNGGGTINLEPAVDKGYQVYTGTATLAGSWVIQIQASPTTPYLDGDEMIVDYRGILTVGGNTVTVFGIPLTTTQALEGRVILLAKYKLSNTTWYYTILYKSQGVDLVSKAYAAATYEPILGNPAGDGYILSSSTLGVRSWIPNSLIGASIVDITYAALSALIANANSGLTPTLVKGQWYNVTDKNVVLLAVDTNNIGLSGYYKAYNADYQGVGIYTGVLAATGITPSGTNQGIWNSSVAHTVGKLVIWGGANWINNNGALGSASSDTALSAAWTKLAVSTTQGYIYEIDAIDYDFANDNIIGRTDKRSNSILSSQSTSFDHFQWGNSNCSNNSIFSNGILYCLNNRGGVTANNVSSDSVIEATRNVGIVSDNKVSTSSTITATNQPTTGTIISNSLSSESNITATSNAGAITDNCIFGSASILAATQPSTGRIFSNQLTNSSYIDCTTSAGNVAGNELNSESFISAPSMSSTGSIVDNSLSSQSSIDATINDGEIFQNNVDSGSKIDASSQISTGIVSLNSLSNNSTIDANNSAGTIEQNSLNSNGTLDAGTLVSTGTINNNQISSEGVLTANVNAGIIEGNEISSAAELNASTNGAAGSITYNKITNNSVLTATTNTGSIDSNLFSRGASINLGGNSATISNQEFSGSGVLGGTQTLTGAGAVSVLKEMTLLVTTGANALTLAAGLEGQSKFIKMKTDGGDGTLTPNALQGGTTITFNDAGDFVLLKYVDSKWNVIVNSGTTIA